MSLLPFTPFDRSFLRAFDDFDRLVPAYWRRVPEENSLAVGNVLGEVQNTPEKFAVSVDVSHFRPEEVNVNVSGKVLTVEGKHEEKTDAHGSIQRSFIRKYTLPDDTDLESVRSSLSDNGKLTIQAGKKNAALPAARAIPITRG